MSEKGTPASSCALCARNALSSHSPKPWLCGGDLVSFLGQAHVGDEAVDRAADLGAVAAGSLDDRCLDDRCREGPVPVQVPRVGGEVDLQEDRHPGQPQGGEPRPGLVVAVRGLEQRKRRKAADPRVVGLERGEARRQGVLLGRLRQEEVAVYPGDVGASREWSRVPCLRATTSPWPRAVRAAPPASCRFGTAPSPACGSGRQSTPRRPGGWWRRPVPTALPGRADDRPAPA